MLSESRFHILNGKVQADARVFVALSDNPLELFGRLDKLLFANRPDCPYEGHIDVPFRVRKVLFNTFEQGINVTTYIFGIIVLRDTFEGSLVISGIIANLRRRRCFQKSVHTIEVVLQQNNEQGSGSKSLNLPISLTWVALVSISHTRPDSRRTRLAPAAQMP